MADTNDHRPSFICFKCNKTTNYTPDEYVPKRRPERGSGTIMMSFLTYKEKKVLIRCRSCLSINEITIKYL